MASCKRLSIGSLRALHILVLAAPAALSACGDNAAGSAGFDSGVCGTSANPGILKVTDVLPTLGSTVISGGISHTFSVVNAPAQFTAFTLKYGSKHTAGGSMPSDPVISASLVGNTMVYRFTVDTWSIVPGHVELQASNGYQTQEGCSWVFPTPIFSYDVVPGPGLDGGIDGAGKLDGAVADAWAVLDGALDAPTADVAAIDRPLVDLPGGETPAIDLGATEAGGP